MLHVKSHACHARWPAFRAASQGQYEDLLAFVDAKATGKKPKAS